MRQVFAYLAALSAVTGASFLETLQKLSPTVARRTEARAAGMNRRGQLGLGTILAAFVVVVAAMVIVLVVDEFDQSLGDPSSSSLSTASNDVLSGFSSMTSLIEPLLLVAIGIVIIGLIRRVQAQ